MKVQHGFSDEAGAHAWSTRVGEDEQKIPEKGSLIISWFSPAAISFLHPRWPYPCPIIASTVSPGL